MSRSAGSEDAYLYVSALRELFGLDPRPSPRSSARRQRTELRRKNRTEACVALRLATRGSALALAQARQVAELLGGAELVEASSDGEPATSRASCAGSSGRCSRARPRSACTRPRTCPGRWPRGWRSPRCRRARTRPTSGSAPASSLERGARGGPGRDRQPAPPRPAARRRGPTCGSRSCTATSTRGCASSPRASWTRSSSPPPACAGSGARSEIAFALPAERDGPAAGQGAWRCRSAPTTRRRRGRRRDQRRDARCAS